MEKGSHFCLKTTTLHHLIFLIICIHDFHQSLFQSLTFYIKTPLLHDHNFIGLLIIYINDHHSSLSASLTSSFILPSSFPYSISIIS
ncbi:hypothetical protein V6R84_03805 [Chryseobacterium sp. CCNWLW24]